MLLNVVKTGSVFTYHSQKQYQYLSFSERLCTFESNCRPTYFWLCKSYGLADHNSITFKCVYVKKKIWRRSTKPFIRMIGDSGPGSTVSDTNNAES